MQCDAAKVPADGRYRSGPYGKPRLCLGANNVHAAGNKYDAPDCNHDNAGDTTPSDNASRHDSGQPGAGRAAGQRPCRR